MANTLTLKGRIAPAAPTRGADESLCIELCAAAWICMPFAEGGEIQVGFTAGRGDVGVEERNVPGPQIGRCVACKGMGAEEVFAAVTRQCAS